MTEIRSEEVIQYLRQLQETLCTEFSNMDGMEFSSDSWQRAEGGGGTSRLLEGGELFERAGVGVSHVMGDKLPPSASANRPELALCTDDPCKHSFFYSQS